MEPEFKTQSTLTDHQTDLQRQFSLRAASFNESANWITSEDLGRAMVAEVKASASLGASGVELCCGTGETGRLLRDAGYRMVGVDITPDMVAAAARHFPATVGNVQALAFADGTLDFAVLRQAYFLLDDGPRALREIRRVLKPSGHLVLGQTMPFGDVDAAWLRKVHELKQKQMTRFFRAEDMVQELEQHGFRVERRTDVRIRESVSRWMAHAPELSPETRERVLDLVRTAPAAYRELRRVTTTPEGEVLEDWNWVILTATPWREGARK